MFITLPCINFLLSRWRSEANDACTDVVHWDWAKFDTVCGNRGGTPAAACLTRRICVRGYSEETGYAKERDLTPSHNLEWPGVVRACLSSTGGVWRKRWVFGSQRWCSNTERTRLLCEPVLRGSWEGEERDRERKGRARAASNVMMEVRDVVCERACHWRGGGGGGVWRG